jgi:hypothetical protein
MSAATGSASAQNRLVIKLCPYASCLGPLVPRDLSAAVHSGNYFGRNLRPRPEMNLDASCSITMLDDYPRVASAALSECRIKFFDARDGLGEADVSARA